MSAGTDDRKISEKDILSDYFSVLHAAYASMRAAFERRVAKDGLTQDALVEMLDSDKALISRRLNGQGNFTLRVLSEMGTALKCRLLIEFQPFEDIPRQNKYFGAEAKEVTSVRNPPITLAKVA